MGFIFFLILAVVVFGIMMALTILRGVGSFIFGNPSSSSQDYNARSGYSGTTKEEHYKNSAKPHRKVFSKDEGEYVKYEEIKE